MKQTSTLPILFNDWLFNLWLWLMTIYDAEAAPVKNTKTSCKEVMQIQLNGKSKTD